MYNTMYNHRIKEKNGRAVIMNLDCGYREVVLDIKVMDRERRTIALFSLYSPYPLRSL